MQQFNINKAKRRLANKEKAIAYLGGKCWRCEETYDRELYDFHHIVPASKKYQWGEMKDKKWEIIKEELDKCILLCSNCHRLAHKEMLNAIL